MLSKPQIDMNDETSSSEDEEVVPASGGTADPSTPVASMLAAEHFPTTPSSRQHQNENAFSSSSEDESDDDQNSVPLIPLEGTERQSEWDKALLRGKPNTAAISEKEFLHTADAEAVEEAGAAKDGKEMSRKIEEPKTISASTGRPQDKSIVHGRSTNAAGVHLAGASQTSSSAAAAASFPVMRPHSTDNLSAGVLPDVLIAMRQRIESMGLFDSDMMRLAATSDDDPILQESMIQLKRSFHQSISAAVLVSLSHKRYERRRLAAMEIDKVVRSLLHQGSYERVRAILLLLADDYVRSTSEDARKGGVVALAACAVGMKRVADKENPILQECRDLILASVVHACQDNNQRVRYYATESLFNVVKNMPILAIQHFFILFEILRSLYADVDVDVRHGAELLDSILKDIVVQAINSGTFTVEACVPVFARFVYIRNKATKRLTLTWLQELSEKLIGSPILEFLHLFLSGIFDMIGDPTVAIRQSALAFLQSVLPKILVLNTDTPLDENRMVVDLDQVLQSLVTTMEHPDPFVRKVSMYWMSRIVKAHIGEDSSLALNRLPEDAGDNPLRPVKSSFANAAAVSVRNSAPHILPGILLSIGDTYTGKASGSASNKDSFLPDQTTRSLAEQTNSCLQASVQRDGEVYVQHLDGFINALREELDSPGGINSRHTAAIERRPFRNDIKLDGTGIERAGWFRDSEDAEKPDSDESLILSRLCALHWIIVLYEYVVPDLLKADFAREFVYAVIHQFVYKPPILIVEKSLEVLAKITVMVPGEQVDRVATSIAMTKLGNPVWALGSASDEEPAVPPMTEPSIDYALSVLGAERKKLISRDREVFWALIQLHAYNEYLLKDLTGVITYMCKLQPSEFVLVAFSIELDRFVRRRKGKGAEVSQKNLKFVSAFVQHVSHVLLNAEEASGIREALKDCVGSKGSSERDRELTRVFHILLHSFSHNLACTLSLCLWSGAYKTASLFLSQIDPLDIDLVFLLEIDIVVELLERPLYRHLHVRMLEEDDDPTKEGSGTMLFNTLKLLSMILPQSTCFRILRDRLSSVSRFRQNICVGAPAVKPKSTVSYDTQSYVTRVVEVRALHCEAAFKAIRADSLETPKIDKDMPEDEGANRREWLGYGSKEEESKSRQKYRDAKQNLGKSNDAQIQEISAAYDDLADMKNESNEAPKFELNPASKEEIWMQYWADT